MKIKRMILNVELNPDVTVKEIFTRIDMISKDYEDYDVDYHFHGKILILIFTEKKLKDICKDCKVKHFDNKEDYLKWVSQKNIQRLEPNKKDKGYTWIKKL